MTVLIIAFALGISFEPHTNDSCRSFYTAMESADYDSARTILDNAFYNLEDDIIDEVEEFSNRYPDAFVLGLLRDCRINRNIKLSDSMLKWF